MKKASTIDEQIERLRSRGMVITDETTARELLLDLGYYRLGFYWFPMEKSYPQRDNRTHLFKDGSTFDESVRLYEFDKALRHLLAVYLEDIEVSLRTKVIYLVSNKYKDNPSWFVDNDVVLSPMITTLEKKYKTDIVKNDVIAQHVKNHPEDKYAPAWKTLEYLSFGDLIRLIDNLKCEELRRQIHLCYGLTDDMSFPNYIEVIREMRNNCAHGHPLFDLKLRKSLRAGKFRKVLKGDQGELYSNLKGVLLVIQYFLFYQPGDKGLHFMEDVKHLMDVHKNEDIIDIVGYINDVPWLEEKL